MSDGVSMESRGFAATTCRWCHREIYPRINTKGRKEWLTYTGRTRTIRLTCTNPMSIGPHEPPATEGNHP